MRKHHSESFKFRVAMAAAKGNMTVSEICQTYQVAASLVHKWKKQLLDNGAAIFSKDKANKQKPNQSKQQVEKLYQTIGQLTVERDFLKKHVDNSMSCPQLATHSLASRLSPTGSTGEVTIN